MAFFCLSPAIASAQTNSISGTVTAAGGGPLAGVSVSVYNAGGTWIGGAGTDPSGHYTMTGLADGTYYVNTVPPSPYVGKVWNNITCAGCAPATAGTPLTVSGAISGIDFVLDQGALIGGTVTDGANGVANINIVVLNTTGQQVASAITGADGTYVTSAMPTGSYRVHTGNNLGYLNQAYGAGLCLQCPTNTGALISAVAGTTTTGIDFALSAGKQFAGKVTDVGGTPVTNGWIDVFDASGTRVGVAGLWPDGTYLTTAVPAGSYRLRTGNVLGFIDEAYDNIVCVNCSPTTGTLVATDAAQVTPNIDFALEAGAVLRVTVTSSLGGPLGGVTISVFDSAGAPLASAVSGADGVVTMYKGLPTGAYFVQSYNATGYIDELYDNIACSNCAVTTGTPVALVAGATTDIAMALVPGARISGRVTLPDGTPLSGVQVSVLTTAGAYVVTGQTAADGTYATPGLVPGSYLIRTDSSVTYVNQVYNGIDCFSCPSTTGNVLTLSAGELRTGINFTTVVGGHISGVVTGAGGAPLAGVGVSIYNAAGSNVNSGLTNASGVYTSRALPAGNYFVRTANNLGYLDKLYNNIGCTPSCTVTTGTPVAVTLGNTTTANFALAQGGRITGTVTGTGGTPLANVTVQIYTTTGTLVTSVATNASGVYLTTGLTAGNYLARTVNTAGYIDKLYNNISCAPSCTVTTGAPIAVANGADVTVNFALVAGATLTGTIANSAGGVAVGVSMSIYNASGAFVASATTNASGVYTSAPITPGNYYMRTTNSVGYVDKLYNTSTICFPSCTVTAGTLTALAVGSNTANMTLDPGGRIAGVVTDNNGGAGIAGISILVALAPSTTSIGVGATTATGNYASSAGLPAGTYWVRTSNSAGYVDEVHNNIACAPNCTLSSGTLVTVTAGNTTTVDFGLDKGAKFSGTVVGPTSGSVQIFNAAGTLVTSAAITAGAYNSPALLPGTYYLRTLNSQAYIDQLYNGITCTPTCTVTTGTPITAAAGTTITTNFVLTVGGSVAGTVKGPDGITGVPGITVELYNQTGSQLKTATTGAGGGYTITGLATGAYLLRTRNTNLGLRDEVYTSPDADSFCVSCAITTSPGTPVAVTAGAVTSSIDFALTQGGFIAGTVTDATTGLPVSGATVTLNGLSINASASTTTDASGNYKTTGLPSGAYVIRYSAVSANHLAGQIYNGIACAGCSSNDGTPIMVTLGSGTPNINLALTHGGHIAGTITDQATSAALSSAVIDVISSIGQVASTTSSNASGAFTSVALPPGTYFVRVRTTSIQSAGYVAKLYNDITCVGCNALTGTPITVAADATVTGVNVALAKGSRISGSVGNGTSLLSGWPVQIFNAAGILLGTSTTDASGNFNTLFGVPAGTYFAKALGSGAYIAQLYGGTPCFGACAPTAGTPITVTAGTDTTGVNFTLAIGGQISGTVTDAVAGIGAAGTSVLIYDDTGTVVGGGGGVSSGGTFITTALRPGTYRAITSNSLGYINQVFGGGDCIGCDPATAGTPIVVTVGAVTTGVDFALTHGGQITGTITGPGGTPLRGAAVQIFSPTSTLPVTTATTNVLGQYTSGAGLPAGTYTVMTQNNVGLVNQIWGGIVCVLDCNPAAGAPVTIIGTANTGGIDFALSADTDVDADGINDSIDKNIGTGANERAIVSNDFSDVQIGGRTAGTITSRGGWMVAVQDVSSAGVRASITGAGATDTIMSVCATGLAEEVQLKAVNDAAAITCAAITGSTTVTAIAAGTHIELRKTIGVITTVIELTTGQTATIGSPAIADPDNTESLVVRILNAITGEEIGTYTLDPGESAEAIANALGDITVDVISGAVTMTVRGVTSTLGEGQTQTFEAPDTMAPVITTPANLSVEATSAAGAVVTFTASATDDRDGAVAVTCTPASGSTFGLGATTVNCIAVDAHGNTGAASFTVTVTAAPPTITPGSMHGDGVVREGDDKYHFDFDVREGMRGRPHNRFTLDIDYGKRVELDKKGRPKLVKPDDSRFRATAFDDVVFSDDPTIRPGRSRRPQVDTVVFSGRGVWNGQAGYTFEVRAADEGEPGRHRESISIVIRNASGAIVAEASGELSSGNLQSLRIHGGHN